MLIPGIPLPEKFQKECGLILVPTVSALLVVGRLRHTFSTHHNLFYSCLLVQKNQSAPDRVNIRAYVEYCFALDSLFRKVQQMVQIQ